MSQDMACASAIGDMQPRHCVSERDMRWRGNETDLMIAQGLVLLRHLEMLLCRTFLCGAAG
jgi:hypothetical protein